jgi:hypothetical protein
MHRAVTIELVFIGHKKAGSIAGFFSSDGAT